MAKINVLGSVLTGSEYAKIKARAEEIGATSVDVRCDDETGELKVWYHKKAPKFERIRRITGYLVGTLDRFNNAKRAEEHDRVKHDHERDGGTHEC